MAWDTQAIKLAIKALGTIESGFKYDAINYSDPITVGVMQWFGTRAAELIWGYYSNEKAAWDAKNNGLVQALKSHSTSDSFWNTYYLDRADGEWLKTYLIKYPRFQDGQAQIDLGKYKQTAISVGIDVEGNTDMFILWCCAYHQSPRQAMRIITNYGAKLTLDMLHQLILADGILGKYVNRYNTALAVIKSGDISGVGSQQSGTSQPAGNGVGVGRNGEQMIQTEDRPFTLRADNTGILELRVNGTYVPAFTTNGHQYWEGTIPGTLQKIDVNVPNQAAPSPGGTPTPSPGGGTAGAKALQWMLARQMKFTYRQAPGRLNPDSSGFGDCSSTMYRAYMDTSGINPGTWTGDQYFRGTAVIARGSGAMSAAQKAMCLPGDMIVMSWGGGYPHTDHVEMFMDAGHTIGHGGPGRGPHINNIGMLSGTAWWTVRRHG